MTKSAFQIQDATVNLIGKAEQQIGSLKADNKANNEVANGHKIGAYCELIAALAPVKLVKGNLPRAASKASAGSPRCCWSERGHHQALHGKLSGCDTAL